MSFIDSIKAMFGGKSKGGEGDCCGTEHGEAKAGETCSPDGKCCTDNACADGECKCDHEHKAE